MQNEKREPMRDDENSQENAAGQERNSESSAAAQEQPVRHGPFTRAAGWLGIAFDRSRVDKREAEERRSRFM